MQIAERLRNTVREVADFPKPGIGYKDITPVLEDPALSREVLEELVNKFANSQVDAVAGIESRGFVFGMALALKLGVPFLLVRKKGKLPSETISYSYELEYGREEIELHSGTIKQGWNVLIHDDLLASGGTAKATARLVSKSGGKVVGFCFLLELGFLEGRKRIEPCCRRVVSLLTY